MNPLIDIAFSLGLLVFLVATATAMAKALTYAGLIVSWRPRHRSGSAAAKQMLGAKTVQAAPLRSSQPETSPFLGILIHHPDVKVIPSERSPLTSKTCNRLT